MNGDLRSALKAIGKGSMKQCFTGFWTKVYLLWKVFVKNPTSFYTYGQQVCSTFFFWLALCYFVSFVVGAAQHDKAQVSDLLNSAVGLRNKKINYPINVLGKGLAITF